MKFYRYNIQNYASIGMDGEYVSSHIPNPRVVLTELNIHKETPKGYWIGYGELREGKLRSHSHWVSKTSRKRYAYPTKEEALNSFRYRQRYGIRILEYQILNRKFALSIADTMYEKEFAKKPQRFIKDESFTGQFEYNNLVREVGTDRIFVYTEHTGACNFNSTFERVIDLEKTVYEFTFEDGRYFINP